MGSLPLNLGAILDDAAPDDRVAIIEIGDGGQRRGITYGELTEKIAAVAENVKIAGLEQGDSVAILAGTSADSLAAFLGVARAGGVAVPVNIKLAQHSVMYVLNDCGARFFFVDKEHRSLLSSDVDAFDIAALSGAATGISHRDYFDPDKETLAAIMYTSGSTGQPKGVPIRHSGYVWAFEQFLSLRAHIESKVGLVAAPLFHMNGQFHLINMLSCGATVVLLRHFSAKGLLDAIDQFSVFRATGVPTMYVLAAEAHAAGDTADLSRVGMLALGSAPYTPSALERIETAFANAEITNGYGTTETGPVAFGASLNNRRAPRGSLGSLMPGVEVRLVNGPLQDQGVLQIRNPMTLKEYHNLPSVTALRLKDDWYDTGDIMRRDKDGFYYFVGRADDMMIVGGENVHPDDVQRCLEAHPAVATAAVVSVADEVKYEKPVAFVVMTEGSAVSEDELKRFTLANGPAYAHPRRIFFLQELPLSGAHKVDKVELKRRALALCSKNNDENQHMPI